MTPTDWRALCAELLDEVAARPLLLDRELIDRARAALAQPEPAVVGPTDEELDAWITECADATRYGPLEHYWAFDVQFDHVRDIARAILARWGRHFPDATKMVNQPAPPAEGEVGELAHWLRIVAIEAFSGRRWHDQLTRAAALLEQRHPAPVPVAWMYKGEPDFDGKKWRENWLVTLDRRLAEHGAKPDKPIPLVRAQIAPAPVPETSGVYYEFVVSDADSCTQAGGIAPTYAQALSEGQHYLAQYQQDGPHTLELRCVEVLNPDALPLPQGEVQP